MKIVSNHYDKLHATECDYGEPVIEASRMIVPTRKLGIIPGHPLNPTNETIFLPECHLVFEKVKKSVRELYDNIEEPPGTGNFRAARTPRIVVDGPFPNVNEPVTLFFIEGAMVESSAWVNWEIESVSLYIEV